MYRAFNILDNNLTASWKPPLICTSCNSTYSSIIKKYQRHRPVALPCMHNICERCCEMGFKQNVLKCNVCKSNIPINKNTSMREQFPFNYHLLGELHYLEYVLKSDITYFRGGNFNGQAMQNSCRGGSVNILKNINQNQMQNVDNEINSSSPSQLCQECEQSTTEFCCVQCKTILCNDCFNAIHSFKALQSHKISKIWTNADTKIGGNKLNSVKNVNLCKIHKNKELELRCIDCNISICSVCSLQHNDHTVKSILVENKKSIIRINQSMEKIQNAILQCDESKRNIKIGLQKLEQHISDTVDCISKYFLDLRTILQILEQRALENIKNEHKTLIKKYNTIDSVLSNNQNQLKESYDSITPLENNLKSPKFMKIIDDTEKFLRNTACIINIDKHEGNPYRFNISRTLQASDFEKGYNIKCNRGYFGTKMITYYGLEFPVVRNDNKLTNNSSLNKSKQFNSVGAHRMNLLNLSRHAPSAINLIREPVTTDEEKPWKIETVLVYVSHIKNPTHFYVQNQYFLSAFDTFTKSLVNCASYAQKPVIIDIDKIYLISDRNKKHLWHRAKVIGQHKDTYKVFFIDYGNAEDVNEHRFRVISEDLGSRPAGASLCSFYNITAPNDEWTDAASLLMSDMIQRKQLSMLICDTVESFDGENELYLVDLIATHLEYPTSIRDTLIFTNCADKKISENYELLRKVNRLEELKEKLTTFNNYKTFHKNLFKIGEYFNVTVVNVTSPSEFYVMKDEYKEQIDSLNRQMNDFYNTNTNKIFLPRVYMICAVYVKQLWLRATIVKVGEKETCTVYLVDIGIMETVKWNMLRVFEERFRSINEGVNICSLSDIEPLRSANYEWTETAITDFKRMAKCNNIKIYINNYRDKCYEVSLMMVMKTRDICVNALLVQNEDAKSTGQQSLIVECNKQLDDFIDLTIVEKSESIAGSEMSCTSVGTTISATATKTAAITKLIRTKVNILHIISPGEFYVNILKYKNAIQLMHTKIQEIMVNYFDDYEYKTNIKWNVNDYCFVYVKIPTQKQRYWYRAKIVNINNDIDDSIDTIIKVFLRDIGIYIEVNKQYLAVHDKTYQHLCNGAIRCHMACVKPAGDSLKWPLTAIDLFQASIPKFERIAVMSQGPAKGDSQSVIVWGMSTECSDPLSPSTVTWLNINKVLVHRGVVHLYEKFLPVKKTLALDNMKDCDYEFQIFDLFKKKKSANIEDKMCEDNEIDGNNEIIDKLIFNDEITTITDWLPDEPPQKILFNGIPTYVDDDGIIYIRDVCQNKILDKIKDIINRKYANSEPESNDITWNIGDPCLVKYHLDKFFYRAVILSIDSNKIDFTVKFIDYGNVEECVASDLRKLLILGHIPIQVTKYRLANVLPNNTNNKNKKWPRETLDFIHAQVVDKICSIRIVDEVQNNANNSKIIKTCTIMTPDINLINVLISDNLAIYGTPNVDSPPSKKRIKLKKKPTIPQIPINNDNNDENNSDGDIVFESKQTINQIINISSSTTTTAKDDTSNKYEEFFLPSLKHHKSILERFNEKNSMKTTLILDDYEELFKDEPMDKMIDSIINKKKHPQKLNSMIVNSDYEDDDKDYNAGDEDNEEPETLFDISCVDEKTWYDNSNGTANPNDPYDQFDEIYSFKPYDTSTQLSELSNSKEQKLLKQQKEQQSVRKSASTTATTSGQFSGFIQLNLNEDINKFYCEVVNIISPLNMHIAPEFPEYQEQFNEMMLSIQSAAKTFKNVKEVDINMKCLAIYREDNLWYRAIVIDYDKELEMVTVLYCDYLNTANLHINKIRRLPKAMLEIPLRFIEIHLYGLKANPRLRSSDIVRKFAEKVNDKKIFVKVKKIGKIPEVEFYSDEDDVNEDVLYNDMITERYFLKSK